ncbi:MAG: ATPase [Rikenellaceae bacterium]|nr:ATPase [Rikenellaceae bacterium]
MTNRVMIVVADGGATKCDWAFVEDDKIVERLKMEGINPFSVSEEHIRKVIERDFLPVALRYDISHIWFYGAGCGFGGDIIKRVLTDSLPTTEIFVGSDIDGAAKACCPNGEGIVCILGTGVSSMQVENGVCTKRLPGPGYILGDEGSGTVMGRMLLSDFIYNQLPSHIHKLFTEEFDVTIPEIIDRTYHKPAANRFFSSFTPFLSRHIEEEYCRGVVRYNFEQLVKRNLSQYDTHRLTVNFVGSVAAVFEDILTEELDKCGMKKGVIVRSPIEYLVKNLTTELKIKNIQC